jgi:hypothetical protein
VSPVLHGACPTGGCLAERWRGDGTRSRRRRAGRQDTERARGQRTARPRLRRRGTGREAGRQPDDGRGDGGEGEGSPTSRKCKRSDASCSQFVWQISTLSRHGSVSTRILERPRHGDTGVLHL